MAGLTYYWVGGAGPWNNSSTFNWSASSGGLGGAGVPDSADDVIFNTASGFSALSSQVTVESGAVCRNFTIQAGITNCVFASGEIGIYGNILISATGASSGRFGMYGVGSHTINIASGHSFDSSSGINMLGGGTYTLAANLNLSGGGTPGYLSLQQGTFNMSTFTISNYGTVGTETLGGTYTTATFNATAAITQGTGTGILRFINGNVNLNAIAITCNTCEFGQNDVNSNLVVTTSAGQTITCGSSFLFSLGKVATNQTLRTVTGALTSFTTLIRTGTTLNITALTFNAGVEPGMSINGESTTAITNITTTTTSGIVGGDVSLCSVFSGKLTGGAMTIGGFRTNSEVALTGTLTLNTLFSTGVLTQMPLAVQTPAGVPVSFAAITIPRQYTIDAAIGLGLGGNFTATGAVTIGDAINGRAGIYAYSTTASPPPTITFAAVTAGFIVISNTYSSSPVGAITSGALTLTIDRSGYALDITSDAVVNIASINATAAQPTNFNNVRIATSGNITISGTTDVGPAGGKGDANLFSSTGSVSHGAITCSGLTVYALTTVTQGAITVTYPFAVMSGSFVINVNSGGNTSTGAITADFSVDTTSNYTFANYGTFAGGGITFGGAVSLGTATYRKGLLALVSAGTGTISHGVINASYVNLTTPGNITGTGTVTLSCANVITGVPQFLLDVGGTATNTAATTAVATTGVAAGIGTKFRVQGAGSASFTNQITGNVGSLDFEFANTGTVSCAAITGGRLFSVLNGNNATFGAISGTEFDSANTGTLTTGAITMAVSAFGGDGTVTVNSTGTATLNGALSCVGFYRYQGNLTLGAFTYAATQFFTVDPGFTLVPSTSTISIGNASAGDITFGHGGYTYNAVNMTGRLGYVGNNVPGVAATAATFAFTGVANPHARAIVYGNLTVTGTGAGALSLVGNSLVNRLSVESYTAGTPVTLSCGNTRVLTNVDFTDITAAGGTTPWALGTSVGDCGGNSLINFTSPVTRYAIASGAWNSTAVWSATPFPGTPGASLPLPQDIVIFEANAGSITVTVSDRRVLGGTLNMTGSTATISFAGNAYGYAFVCGAVTIPSSATMSGSGYKLNLSTRTNRVYAYSPASSDLTLSVYAPNTIVTQFGSLVGSVFTVEAGTWNTQVGGAPPDYNITVNDLNIAGQYSSGGDPVFYGMAPTYAGVIKLKCNSSLITYRGTFSVSSLATLEADTSTIKASPLTGTFAQITYSGSGSFYNLAVEATVVSSGVTVFNDITVTNSIVVPVTSTYPTKLRSNIQGGSRRGINLTGATTPLTISTPNYIIFQDLNLTLTPQVTTTQAKYKRVTVTGTTLRAYGLANLGGNINIDFVSAVKTAVYSGINTTYTIPNVSELLITVVGGGGQAGKPSTANITAGGGGGGGVAILEAFTSVTPNSTIYVNAAAALGTKTTAGDGTAGSPSWVNFTANSIPLSVAQGVLANGGGAGTAAGTGGSGGTSIYGTDLYPGGAGNKGGGTANFLSSGFAGNVRGGAGTNASSTANNGGAGISGGGGTGGTSSARTPTSGGAGTNGGGGGGGGQVLQVRTAAQPASRPNGSSLCTINATSHGLLDGETANITFGFKSGTYSTGSFSGATATRNNGSTTLSVTTTSNHNLTTNDVINLTSAAFVGGSYSSTTTVNSSLVTRPNGSSTCTIVTSTPHGMSTGNVMNLNPVFLNGSYSRSGTLVTCTVTNHNLVNGQTYYIDFTSGAALDGSYVVTVVNSSTFRVTTVASGATSGILSIGGSTQLTAGNYTVTVTNSTTFTFTTAQTTGFSSNSSSVRTPIATCNVPGHGLTDGLTYYMDFTSGTAPDGSYVVTVVNSSTFRVNLVSFPNIFGNVTVGGGSQLTTGNYTVTVTGSTTFTTTTAQSTGIRSTVAGTTPFATFSVNNHGLTTGQTYYLDFTSGTGPDGSYVITSTGTNSFTTTLVTTPGASGNVTIGGSSQLTNGDYVVAVVTLNQFTITTIQTTGVATATATSVLVNSTVVGGAGGAGADYNSVSYVSYNNTPVVGTIGLGGAGGGGGGATLTSGSTPNYGKGGAGANGGIGAGGGGGGSFGSANPSSDAGDGGGGGAGLVIITYAAPRSVSRTAFIM